MEQAAPGCHIIMIIMMIIIISISSSRPKAKKTQHNSLYNQPKHNTNKHDLVEPWAGKSRSRAWSLG
jgi:hypothetical protein